MTLLTLIWLPLLAAPVVYLAGRLAGRARELALLALLATWTPFVILVMGKGDAAAFTYGAITLQWDGLSLLLALTALGLGTVVTLYSYAYMADETGTEKYYAMLVAMIGVMIGLGCARDLFNLWLWFEAMAVSSYLLVAFYREQPASLEAGIKYLVQSATGSVLVLLGIALVLAETGTLDLANLGSQPSIFVTLAGGLFVIGFGVKAALVPLHTWLPDAHAQAPSGISAMLSGVVIEAGLIAMLRVLAALAGGKPVWGWLLLGFAAANIILGNLLALRQTQVKRLLAFSSLAHVGYMLLGLGAAFALGTTAGAEGSFFHLLSHALLKGLAFLAVGTLLYALHRTTHDNRPLLISDLDGASTHYPMIALVLSLAVLGLGGLPPLVGFMSKWQILTATFATQNGWLITLVIVAALNSVLSLAYYAPLVNAMYRHKPSVALAQVQPLPATMTLPLILLALAIVLLGFWPGLVQSVVGNAAAVLFP
ncbi:MAG: NADH dehydrogenase [Chloroflexi bacterium]|nr:NADH dehydrogenase [Chloroflexota bacterium]